MQRIGLFGGSFNPIHQGHVALATDAARLLALDKVFFIPLGLSSRAKPLASRADRLALIRQMIKDDPILDCLDLPLDGLTGIPVEALKPFVKGYQGASLYYLIGADAVPDLLHWPQVAQLFKFCEVAVYPARGVSTVEQLTFLSSFQAKAFALDAQPIAWRTEDLRQALAQGDDVSEWLPEDVAQQIARRGLYVDDILSHLAGLVRTDRLQHTLSVRDTAVALAEGYGVRTLQKVAVAALLHDCAKHMRLSDMQALVHAKGTVRDTRILKSAALLHGFAGAILASERFHVTDEDILNAIRYHTIGRPGMSLMEQIIYVADAIEPLRRPYPGLEDIRAVAPHDIARAADMSKQAIVDYLTGQGLPVYSESLLPTGSAS